MSETVRLVKQLRAVSIISSAVCQVAVIEAVPTMISSLVFHSELLFPAQGWWVILTVPYEVLFLGGSLLIPLSLGCFVWANNLEVQLKQKQHNQKLFLLNRAMVALLLLPILLMLWGEFVTN